jgi:dCMP deaminase
VSDELLDDLSPAGRATTTRPGTDEYFMGIALAVRERANCQGSRVGAVLVLQDRVIVAGCSGTPEGMANCDEGGCERCANRGKKYESGTFYDVCICVHAEQNAVLSAARFGIPVEGPVMYTTTRPCFGCAKELLQAKVRRVYYLHEWAHPRDDLQDEYFRLLGEFPEGVDQLLGVDDPKEEWARGRSGAAPTDTGHSGGGA